MKKKSDLSFEDFDYAKAKAQLPDGYEPLPYLEIQPPKAEKLVKIIGYSSAEDATKRAIELQSICRSTQFQVIPYEIEQTIKSFAIIAPESCKNHLLENEKLLLGNPPIIRSNNYDPTLYRFLDKKEYEDNFFNNGELLISTFQRCKTEEVKNRQDIHETQNKIIIKDGEYSIETVMGLEFPSLLLCTSLSQENLQEDGIPYKYGFKIKKPSQFLDMLTKALVSKGIEIYDILRGPCVYNNKLITINATGTGLIKKLIAEGNAGRLDFNPLLEFIQEQAQNDIMMNKPTAFASENEYRFIWKLLKPIRKDDIADDVELWENGCIVVKVPELVQFCERL